MVPSPTLGLREDSVLAVVGNRFYLNATAVIAVIVELVQMSVVFPNLVVFVQLYQYELKLILLVCTV